MKKTVFRETYDIEHYTFGDTTVVDVINQLESILLTLPEHQRELAVFELESKWEGDTQFQVMVQEDITEEEEAEQERIIQDRIRKKDLAFMKKYADKYGYKLEKEGD